jgi:hypothetical protein
VLREFIEGALTIILDDLNAKIGHRAVERVIGKYCLDDKNDRGDMLVQFCLDGNISSKTHTISRHTDCIRENRYEITAKSYT